MSIRDIFKRPSDSIEALTKKHRDLSQQKESLEKRLDDLRSQSLKQDIPDLAMQLETIKEEILLADAAMQETKRALEKKVGQDIASEWRSLDSERQKYESKLIAYARKSGRALGEAVKSLQIGGYSFSRNLAEIIRLQVVDFEKDHRYGKQMSEFLKEYSGAIDADIDDPNFSEWRKKILATEKLEPGQPGAELAVKGRVRRLLSA
jgi:exonuclease VII large subunit